MNFETCVEKVLAHEGGYVDHPSDPGGETNWGITKQTAVGSGYTGDMKALTRDQAKVIYKKLFWDTTRCEELPPLVRYPVFDAAVNSGVANSVRWLQRALGVEPDGVIGKVTLAAANEANPEGLKSKILSQRLRFMASLPHWNTFSRGWANRIADLLNTP